MLYWSKYIYHIVVLTEIYCRFTIIDYTTYSFLSLKCVYIFWRTLYVHIWISWLRISVVLHQSLGKDRDNAPNQATIALFHTLVSFVTTRRYKHSNIRILFYLTNILPHSLEPLHRVCVCTRHLVAAVYITSEPSGSDKQYWSGKTMTLYMNLKIWNFAIILPPYNTSFL